MRQLEAYGDAYEHAEPCLLGNQHAEGASALLPVLLARDAAHLSFVYLSEPATFVERFGEYPLESRRRVHHDILCVRETSRFDQRLERRVNFGGRIGAIRQSHLIIGAARAQTVLARLKPKPSIKPSAAPVIPANQLTSGRAYGIASSTTAIAAVASRSPS
jgi:hypothetical protein